MLPLERHVATGNSTPASLWETTDETRRMDSGNLDRGRAHPGKTLPTGVLLTVCLTAAAQTGHASDAAAWTCDPPPRTTLSWAYEMSLPGQLPVVMTTRYKNGYV